MGLTLSDAEYFADTISKRVEQLINERNNLRLDLSKNSNGSLEHNRAFIRAFQENIISNAIFSEKITKLEHILTILS